MEFVICDFYRKALARHLIGELMFRPAHIAVGTGLCVGDPRELTELVDELDRTEVTSREIRGTNLDVAKFSAVFTQSAAVGIWYEIGLFDVENNLLVRGENADGFTIKVLGEVRAAIVQVMVL